VHCLTRKGKVEEPGSKRRRLWQVRCQVGHESSHRRAESNKVIAVLLSVPRVPTLCATMSNGILIVDDNANIRRLLRSFVETNTGFKVCGEAENGAEAIEKAKELQPDLILLDLTLPGMTGTQAAPILRKLMPNVKIILFTMHADGVNKALASAFGIDLVLTKADSITTLREHLTALLMPVDAPTRAADLRKNTKLN
jgi:CheY-like chemotaxis protein